jgi:uncharacterized repeat protein (TIGR01451 family)
LAAVCAAALVCCAGAPCALAGTTVASTLSKTGIDASSGSMASSGGPAGATAVGHTIDWVLSYQNTTGSSANVNVTDPLGANQTFVPGSLRVPPGFSPRWSTNGGGSYVPVEPASGVNAIGASGTSVGLSTGSEAVTQPPRGSFVASSGGGDGYEALFIGSDIYNVHHHAGGGTATQIDCHDPSTGLRCSGAYPAYVSATAGAAFGTGGNTLVTAQNNQADVVGTRIYFPAGVIGRPDVGVACADVATQTSCGFVTLGTEPSTNKTNLAALINGGAVIGSKYYMVGFAGGIYCFDTSTRAACPGFPLTGVADPGAGQLFWEWYTVQAFDNRYLFGSFPRNSNHLVDLTCIDTSTNASCPGFPKVGVATSNQPGGFTNTVLAPILDAAGNLTGICNEDAPNATSHPFVCFDLNGSPVPTPFSTTQTTGTIVNVVGFGSVLRLGSKLYFAESTAVANDPATYTCWDYATRTACAGFTPASTGAGVQAYTLRQDPQFPDCIWEEGNADIFEVFSATFGGTSCKESPATVDVTPSASYCDGAGNHVAGWKAISIGGLGVSDYNALAVTITDANGNPVPGWTDRVFPSGQVPIDISSIPYSGTTTSLHISVSISWGTHPVKPATFAATFTGDPVQVCFQTVVGAAKCSADQSITNSGTAVTVGDNGVSDGPAGNGSGDATLILAAVPGTSGCEADLSIAKAADGASVLPGGELMYTLVVRNHGPETATGVRVSDAIPAGLSVVSVEPSQGSCATAGAIDCSLGTVVGGGSAQVLVAANVAAGASGSIRNCATTSAFQDDPHPANNDGCVTVSIPPPPPPAPPPPAPPSAPSPSPPSSDLRVVKRAHPGVVRFGEAVSYKIVVTNKGSGSAPDVGVTDTSAVALRVLSIKPSQGSCTKGVPFTCKLRAIAAGKTAKVTVRAIPRRTGTVINAVTATPGCTSSGVCGIDQTARDNLARAKIKVRPSLVLVKTVSSHVVNAGQRLTYRLKVHNPTPDNLKPVRVCDRLPLGLVYVGSRPKARLSMGRQCWSYRVLRAHQSKTIKLIAMALPGASGKLVNHATASANGVKTVHAHQTVNVTPAPPPRIPVTG